MIGSSGMTEEEMERYAVLLQTSGNRPDIFGDDIYAVTGEYTDYDIPGEALTDVKFAKMIREAEKYLGYTKDVQKQAAVDGAKLLIIDDLFSIEQ